MIPGVADKSYGIHVAALAGLPKIVINKAEQILIELEKTHGRVMDLDLKDISVPSNPLAAFVDSLDIDNLSPKEALEILYKLKQI